MLHVITYSNSTKAECDKRYSKSEYLDCYKIKSRKLIIMHYSLFKTKFSLVTADCMSVHFHAQGSECNPPSYFHCTGFYSVPQMI